MPVDVHFIYASTEGAVLENLKRKEQEAERMAGSMVAHMADITSDSIHSTVKILDDYQPTEIMQLPEWIHE